MRLGRDSSFDDIMFSLAKPCEEPAGGCQGEKSLWNQNACECECPVPNAECPAGQGWNPATCGCQNCPGGDGQPCNDPFSVVFRGDQCICECDPVELDATCVGLKTKKNLDKCECECPDNACPPQDKQNQTLTNPDNCSCLCPELDNGVTKEQKDSDCRVVNGVLSPYSLKEFDTDSCDCKCPDGAKQACESNGGIFSEANPFNPAQDCFCYRPAPFSGAILAVGDQGAGLRALEGPLAKCVEESEYLANPGKYELLATHFLNMQNCEFWSTDFLGYWEQTEACWLWDSLGLEGLSAYTDVPCSAYRSGSFTESDCSWACNFKSRLGQTGDPQNYTFSYTAEVLGCSGVKPLWVHPPTRNPMFSETPIQPRDPLDVFYEYIWSTSSVGDCSKTPDNNCPGGFLPFKEYPCPASSSTSENAPESSSSTQDGSSSSEDASSSSSSSSSSEDLPQSSSSSDSSSISSSDSSSSSESIQYYCVTSLASVGCDEGNDNYSDNVSIPNFCSDTDESGQPLWPLATTICVGYTDCTHRTFYPNGCPQRYLCGCLDDQNCCRVCGSLNIQSEGSIFKIPVSEYDPSIHVIVSGPISESESCLPSSSSSVAPSSECPEIEVPIGCPCGLAAEVTPEGCVFLYCDECEEGGPAESSSASSQPPGCPYPRIPQCGCDTYGVDTDENGCIVLVCRCDDGDGDGPGGGGSSTSQQSSSSSVGVGPESSSSSSSVGVGPESSSSSSSVGVGPESSSSSSEEDSSSSSSVDVGPDSSSSSSSVGVGPESSSSSSSVDVGPDSSSSSSEEDSSSSSEEDPSSSSSVDVGPDSSSSSSEEDSSSSSEEDSSSSSDCSFGLESSLVAVLDSNPDLDGFYYGEDEYGGLAIVSPYPVEIRYENLGLGGLPRSANIFVDGQAVATINFQPAHIGTLFALVYDGRVRCGIITQEDIQL
jgi:hypothetical protein